MPADLNDYFKKNGQGGDSSSKNSFDGQGGDSSSKNSFEPPQFFKDLGKKAGLLYLLIILIGLFIVAKPFVIINSGEVGIKATAGKYDPTALAPGLHFFIPFIQDVFIVDTKVRIINYTNNQDIAVHTANLLT